MLHTFIHLNQKHTSKRRQVCVVCVGGEGEDEGERLEFAIPCQTSVFSDTALSCVEFLAAILTVEVIVALASLAVIVCVACLYCRGRRKSEAPRLHASKLNELVVNVNLFAQTQEVEQAIRYTHN